MRNYKNAIEKIRNIPPCLPKTEDDSIYTTIHKFRHTIPQPTAFLRAEARTKLFSDVYKIGQEAMKHAK